MIPWNTLFGLGFLSKAGLIYDLLSKKNGGDHLAFFGCLSLGSSTSPKLCKTVKIVVSDHMLVEVNYNPLLEPKIGVNRDDKEKG